VTPLIGDDGSIQLNIDQTVDDDQGSTSRSTATPADHRPPGGDGLHQRDQDGQMAVLGGLQSSGRTTDKQKLGLLYQIPIISNLLGYRDNDLERTELLLFIRPHVLRPDEETGDTKKQIDGMSNKEQIHKYLKDPAKDAGPPETLKEKLEN
jgi:general secretion pathway protein D